MKRLLAFVTLVLAFAMAPNAAWAADAPQLSKAVWTSEDPGLTAISAVCCKRGRADWWAPSVRRCHAAGGHVAHPSYCAVDVRVCCKRGRYEWWAASHRACHWRGGVSVHPRWCR